MSRSEQIYRSFLMIGGVIGLVGCAAWVHDVKRDPNRQACRYAVNQTQSAGVQLVNLASDQPDRSETRTQQRRDALARFQAAAERVSDVCAPAAARPSRTPASPDERRSQERARSPKTG